MVVLIFMSSSHGENRFCLGICSKFKLELCSMYFLTFVFVSKSMSDGFNFEFEGDDVVLADGVDNCIGIGIG